MFNDIFRSLIFDAIKAVEAQLIEIPFITNSRVRIDENVFLEACLESYSHNRLRLALVDKLGVLIMWVSDECCTDLQVKCLEAVPELLESAKAKEVPRSVSEALGKLTRVDAQSPLLFVSPQWTVPLNWGTISRTTDDFVVLVAAE